MSLHDRLPVAVIGAGPVGLAAACRLIERGLKARVYETGHGVGANIRQWGHVRLFSPWKFNIDEAAASLLDRHGWRRPGDMTLPTGHEICDQYLDPLARIPAVQQIIETRAKVRSITRDGIDKVVSRDRASRAFILEVETGGAVRRDRVRAVIDASGTFQSPNPLGASGAFALGESGLAHRIAYGIPDAFKAHRRDYAGLRVLVVGGGHSAANALLDLASVAETDRNTRIIWAVRAQNLTRVFGGGEADQLPARGMLGERLRALTESGRLQVVTGFSAVSVSENVDGVLVSGMRLDAQEAVGPVDRIIVATGQRPQLDLTRELRLDLDPILESPRALGPLIDPNLHSCGTVPPHGYRHLSHPEPEFFTVGIKSYGRAPTFLMATGYEQVRSVVAHIAGDRQEADEVHLVLPETGVCSTNIAQEDEHVACCGGSASKERAGVEEAAHV